MDLFQGLVLGLLAVSVLVLAGIFTRLGPIKRSLEASAVHPTVSPSPEEEGERAAAEAGTAPETTTEAVAGEGEPASEGAWELVPVADPEPEEARPEPVAAQEPEPEPAAAQEPEPVATEEPEEKPFHRDGRWWFRRDDELLVYDEASGEWQPGDSGAGEGPFVIAGEHRPAASHEPGSDLSREPAGVVIKERETVSEEAGEVFPEGEATEQLAASSFWKCATCGAVNGSTATTCRMCFAARP